MTTLRSFQAEIDSFANDQHKAHLREHQQHREHQQQVAMTTTSTTKGSTGRDGKVKAGGGGGAGIAGGGGRGEKEDRVDDGVGEQSAELELEVSLVKGKRNGIFHPRISELPSWGGEDGFLLTLLVLPHAGKTRKPFNPSTRRKPR
jgi:hypothetical protein